MRLPLASATVLICCLILFAADVHTAQAPTTDAVAAGPAIEHRHTVLIQLAVSDLDRAIDFYCRILGFELESRDDRIAWARIDPGIDGVTVGLGAQAVVTGSGSVSANFAVADVEGAASALRAAGVVVSEVKVVPGVVRLIDFTDPDGNRLRFADHNF